MDGLDALYLIYRWLPTAFLVDFLVLHLVLRSLWRHRAKTPDLQDER